MVIKEIAQNLINQIAAGEVVERPSSVVKELLENSLDAGATEITIEVEKGGIQSIKISDNGFGIARDDLPLAVKRHATSKITTFDDLINLHSFGFRGEALASIAAVSHFALASRVAESNAGWQIDNFTDGELFNIVPVAHAIGTTITVQDLFYNVPARQKFLRSPQTEFNHLVDVVGKVALSRFDVAFTLKHQQRLIWHFPQVKSLTDSLTRIGKIVDQEFTKQSYRIDVEQDGLKLSGWISTPQYTRSQADLQFLYVNGRIVRDKTISHAIKQAYQNTLFLQRCPIVILYLEVDPQLVDVNVHPAKAEVRFSDSQLIHNFIVHSLRDILAHQGVNALLNDRQTDIGVMANTVSDEILGDEEKFTLHEPILKDSPVETSLPNVAITSQDVGGAPLNLQQLKTNLQSYQCMDNFAQTMIEARQTVLQVDDELVEEHSPLGKALAQIGDTYLLAENAEGLVIVDIHAAYERINYERLKKEYNAVGIMSQNLLLPYTLQLTERELGAVEHNQTLIEKLGFTIQRSSPTTALVRAVPVILQHTDIERLVKDLIADLIQQGSADDLDRQIQHLLATLACHTSVRAGQKLSLEELNYLLRTLEKTAFGDRCGHGRPVWLQYTLKDLAKQFLRT